MLNDTNLNELINQTFNQCENFSGLKNITKLFYDNLLEDSSEEFLEEFFWEHIGMIDWYSLTKEYSFEANDKLKEKLILDYSNSKFIGEFKNFIVEKRKKLQDKIEEYVDEFGVNIPFSDDTLWDISAHIVGMGKTMYEFAMNNPKIINLMLETNDYMENFEYAFDTSVYELNGELEEIDGEEENDIS